MKCWASEFTTCAGPQSGEHYFSKSLFDGNCVTFKGLSWCRGRAVAIPLSKAKANILCKRHNELLSGADDEASKFQSAIERLHPEPQLASNGGTQSPSKRITLSGLLLSRWLTKTYCNVQAVEKRPIDERFVAHSFGGETQTLRFYLHAGMGLKSQFKTGDVRCQGCWDDRGNTVWFVRLAGVDWIVSTVGLRELGDHVPLDNQWYPIQQFHERPHELKITPMIDGNRPVTTGLLELLW